MPNPLKFGNRFGARLAVPIACLVGIAISGCSTPVIVQADQLCRDWIVLTKSKHDRLTEQTASDMEASNKSRVNWGCAPDRNEARS